MFLTCSYINLGCQTFCCFVQYATGLLNLEYNCLQDINVCNLDFHTRFDAFSYSDLQSKLHNPNNNKEEQNILIIMIYT